MRFLSIINILHHLASSHIIKSQHAGGVPRLGGHRVPLVPTALARQAAMPRGRGLLWLPPNSIYFSFKALWREQWKPRWAAEAAWWERLSCCSSGTAALRRELPKILQRGGSCPTAPHRGVCYPKSHCEGRAVPEQGLCGSQPLQGIPPWNSTPTRRSPHCMGLAPMEPSTHRTKAQGL